MKHTTIVLKLCLAALLAAPLARAAPRDVSAEIAAQRGEFVSAKVFHLPDSLSFRTARDEAYTASGCFYAASGDDLAALLDVLAAAELRETPPNAYGFEVRTIIYLAKRDGGTVPLLLNLHFPGGVSHGNYERAMPIEASAAFSTALHAWMAPRNAFYPGNPRPCTDTIHLN